MLERNTALETSKYLVVAGWLLIYGVNYKRADGNIEVAYWLYGSNNVKSKRVEHPLVTSSANKKQGLRSAFHRHAF